MNQQTFAPNGSEFDAALAEISIEERLKRIQAATVCAMAMLPQSMQDEIVTLTRMALEKA